MGEVRAVGGTNIKETHLGIIFANLTDKQASDLRDRGALVTRVKAVATEVAPPAPSLEVAPPAPVGAAPLYTAEQLSWAAGYEGLRDLAVPPLYGARYNVAVLDTGIRASHEQIKGRVVYSKNYTSSPPGDGFNHGTGVAGIILTIAPLCNILDMKVLSDKGEGTEEEVVLAIDDSLLYHERDAESYGPLLVNLSLGVEDDGNPNSLMRVACRAAVDSGAWVFAAAGNSGPIPGTIMSPACERYVVAIGSVGYSPFIVSSFSSRGPTLGGLIKPDVVMFGENMIVASSVSDTATIAKGGTSFACPFAPGMCVIYHEALNRQAVLVGYVRPELVSIKDALDGLMARYCGKPEGASIYKDNDYGYGLPFGPLVREALAPGVQVDISTLLALPMMMAVMIPIMKMVK